MIKKTSADKIHAERVSGFTLVEILVILVIVSILITVLYPLFTSSLGGVYAGKRKLSNLQDAAITLEYIKHDLKGGYFKKTFIKGKEVDGCSYFIGGDGMLEFAKLYYDDNGDECLQKVSYKFNKTDESIERSEEGQPSRPFARGKIKKFLARMDSVGDSKFVEVTIKTETENKQPVELVNAIFPRDVQAVNRHWIPNPY